MIKNWLGKKGLQLLEMLTPAGKENCETSEGIFKTLNDKSKPHYIITIKSLLFHKLYRQTNENAEEWMGRPRVAATECNYKEIDRQLNE